MMSVNLKKVSALVTLGLCWMAVEGMQSPVGAKECKEYVHDCTQRGCEGIPYPTLKMECKKIEGSSTTSDNIAKKYCLDTCKQFMAHSPKKYCTGECE